MQTVENRLGMTRPVGTLSSEEQTALINRIGFRDPNVIPPEELGKPLGQRLAAIEQFRQERWRENLATPEMGGFDSEIESIVTMKLNVENGRMGGLTDGVNKEGIKIEHGESTVIGPPIIKSL